MKLTVEEIVADLDKTEITTVDNAKQTVKD